MREPAVKPKSPDEDEVDRLLGKRALFKMSEVRAMGGPSPPTLYRAAREGLIESSRTAQAPISRAAR